MKSFWNACAMATAMLVVSAAGATSLSGAPTVLEAGKWRVLRAIDPMTDKVTCVAIYDNDYGIQLSEEALYIHVEGGPQMISFRFDDEPASGSELTSEVERKIDNVSVKGRGFTKLLDSKRLRYSSFTILDRVVEGDLDLDGIKSAHDSIMAGCPGNSITAVHETEKKSACSASMQAKLKGKGMSQVDIDDVCR